MRASLDAGRCVTLDRVATMAEGLVGSEILKIAAEIRAMRETGLSALGRHNSRGKSYLVLLSPMQDGIVMHQLNYADEVLMPEDIGRTVVKKINDRPILISDVAKVTWGTEPMRGESHEPPLRPCE